MNPFRFLAELDELSSSLKYPDPLGAGSNLFNRHRGEPFNLELTGTEKFMISHIE